MSRKQTATTESQAPLPGPSSAEKHAIERARMRVGGRSPRVRVDYQQDNAGALTLLSGAHSDREGGFSRLEDMFGTRGTDFPLSQLNRLMTACRDSEGKIDKTKINSLLAMVEGAAPANEVQAALAVQMALTHHAAQMMLERTLRADQTPQFECASNAAVKLSRTCTMQVETLAKLKRGGEQVVKVVHVHPGAQAIVGNVVQASGSAGGGGAHENRNQPHAPEQLPAPDTPRLPEVWSEDAGRITVSVSSGER